MLLGRLGQARLSAVIVLPAFLATSVIWYSILLFLLNVTPKYLPLSCVFITLLPTVSDHFFIFSAPYKSTVSVLSATTSTSFSRSLSIVAFALS